MARPLFELTHDTVKPDSNITKHWTTRLKTDDPDYHTHNITLGGDRVLAIFDGDKNRRELTCQEGFERGKESLCKLALCRQPDFDKEIVLCVDSSQFGMGAVAASEINGKLCPLEFYSANHTKEARRYSSSEREALAIVCATTAFAPLISGSRWKLRILSDHSGLTALTKPTKKMNSVRLAGWAAKLQNITTASGEFSIEYSSGSSKAISSGADALSRLLDRGLTPKSDDFNTVAYRDYPAIQMIYDQLDRDMDSRGRTIGAISSTAAPASEIQDIVAAAYIPDDIFYSDGKQYPGFSDVHPSLLKASNTLHQHDRQCGGIQLVSAETIPNMVNRTKVVFQRPDGHILLMQRDEGGYALPTWIHEPRSDNAETDSRCTLPPDIAAMLQSYPGKGFDLQTFALPTTDNASYRHCFTAHWENIADALEVDAVWTDSAALPMNTIMEDMMYLHDHTRSTALPNTSRPTPSPLVTAWDHERRCRHRSSIPVMAPIRPNKKAKGTHTNTTFMAAENDTLALISKIPAVRAVMQHSTAATVTSDRHYASVLSNWNSRLFSTETSNTMPWNRTFPKGGTVVYLTPGGEQQASISVTDVHRHNLAIHPTSGTSVDPLNYIGSPYWTIYCVAPRTGTLSETMSEALRLSDCNRLLCQQPRDLPAAGWHTPLMTYAPPTLDSSTPLKGAALDAYGKFLNQRCTQEHRQRMADTAGAEPTTWHPPLNIYAHPCSCLPSMPLRGDELRQSLPTTNQQNVHDRYMVIDSLLYYRRRNQQLWRLVIPHISQQTDLIRAVHEDFHSHPGPTTTSRLLSEHYYWRNMHIMTKHHIRECQHCQKQKQRNIAAYGQLTDPIEPTECGTHWGLDYICSLGSEGYMDWDSCMVCTDRYSRMTYAFPCHASINSQQAAELFHKKIVLELGYGIPISIYSDMDPTMRSEFSKHFWAIHGTRMTTTTAFHSLANFVEARNKYLEQNIRGHGLYTDGWLKRLPYALFTINSMPSRRIGISPLEILTGRTPMRPSTMAMATRRIQSGNKSVQQRLDDMMALQYESEEINRTVRAQERKMYNQHKSNPAWFNAIGPGCKVLVESKHMSMPIKAYSKPKWTAKYYGPFTVKAIVDRTVVELELPPGSRVHPRFDISRVKPFYERSMLWIPPGGDTTQAWSPDLHKWHPPYVEPDWLHQPEEQLPEVLTSDDYEVKTILAHREDRDGIRYLVMWSNYQIEESTWVHADKCVNAADKIQEYHDRVLRMTSYQAQGETSTVDYMQLAAIILPRTDDYLYQILKSDDYAQCCGATAPQHVLSSVGGSWSQSTPCPHQSTSESKVIDSTQDSSTSCQHRHRTSPYKVCNCTTGTEQQGTATVRTQYRLMDDRTTEDRSG
jgi:hypothetical protein